MAGYGFNLHIIYRLFSIKNSHIYKFYRNAHYRNVGYDCVKVQI